MPFRISTDWFDDCESELSFGPHKFTFRKNISKHINLVCEWIDMCVCVCVASASAHFSNNKRYKFTSIFRSHGYLTWSLLLLLSLKPYMWVCVLCRAAFVLFYAHLRFYLPIRFRYCLVHHLFTLLTRCVCQFQFVLQKKFKSGNKIENVLTPTKSWFAS